MSNLSENQDKQKKLYKLELRASFADYEAVCAILAQFCSSGWQENELATEVEFVLHSIEADFLQNLRANLQTLQKEVATSLVLGQISSLVDQDWFNNWKEFFQPLEIGSFLILPMWKKDQVKADKKSLIINPSSAFGTGQHQSTALCLKFLSELFADSAKMDWQFLDLGTGSGILGIACSLFGLKGVGLDIDPLAIANATENRDLNQISQEQFILDIGSLEKLPSLGQDRQFDLVLANILAKPLIELAQDLTKVIKEQGKLILSGILAEQASTVTDAYLAQGLQLAKTKIDGNWAALLFTK